MIADVFENHRIYDAHSRLKQAFSYLDQTDLLSLAPGRYDIDGSDLYLMIQEYETRDKGAGKTESHMEYIDIQYVLDGEELMGYAPVSRLELTEDQRPEKDNKLYRDEKGELSFVKIKAGMFAIFFPHDAHMPNIAVSEKRWNKKAVVKVRI